MQSPKYHDDFAQLRDQATALRCGVEQLFGLIDEYINLCAPTPPSIENRVDDALDQAWDASANHRPDREDDSQ